jgi:type IV secretion system protein VirB2
MKPNHQMPVPSVSAPPALQGFLGRLRGPRTLQSCPAHRPGALRAALAALLVALAPMAWAQGFEKINTTVTNVNAILVTISIAVVTIAIIWAGFKMIFAGARLADVANVLIGGTLVGGAAAFAAFIVS